MDFGVWKAKTAAELERTFGWERGEGAKLMTDTGDQCWRDAFDDGLSPEECAAEEAYAAADCIE